jgi:catechol 2,3-dioxygenase-like lactoylglutathione lyase family enzyme
MARPRSDGPPIRVTGVSELVLEVVDLDRALRFYLDVLGFPLISRHEDGERAWVMVGTRTRLGLWRPQVGIAGGRGGLHVHYALHLDDPAYEEAVARLRSYGYEPEEHAFDDRGRAAYVDDPDGNVVELWTWDVADHLEP